MSVMTAKAAGLRFIFPFSQIGKCFKLGFERTYFQMYKTKQKKLLSFPSRKYNIIYTSVFYSVKPEKSLSQAVKLRVGLAVGFHL